MSVRTTRCGLSGCSEPRVTECTISIMKRHPVMGPMLGEHEEVCIGVCQQHLDLLGMPTFARLSMGDHA